MKLKNCIIIAQIFLLAACGDSPTEPVSGGTPSVPPPVTQFAGDWTAMITVTGGAAFPVGTKFPAVFTLNQSGTSVGGSFAATSKGSSGTMSGTVQGSVVTLTWNQTAPCTSTFTGTATLTNGQLSGSYSGTDCARTLTATFTATR